MTWVYCVWVILREHASQDGTRRTSPDPSGAPKFLASLAPLSSFAETISMQSMPWSKASHKCVAQALDFFLFEGWKPIAAAREGSVCT